jgi:hypothetical protein
MKKMFGSNRTSPPSICSYAEAVEVYNNIKPVRGRSPNERPLAGRSNWNLTIRTDFVGSFVVRLHQTDVVVYTKDGHILLEPYGSRLTNDVVGDLLWGTGIRPHWKDTYQTPRYFTEVGGKYYHTPNYVDILDGQIVGGTKPVDIPRVDRKVLNAALKQYRFNEFKLWLMTLDRLGHYEPMRAGVNSWAWQKPTADAVCAYLEAGPEGWRNLIVEHTNSTISAEHMLDYVRCTIRDHEDCLHYETVHSFDSYRDLDNAIKAIRRFA